MHSKTFHEVMACVSTTHCKNNEIACYFDIFFFAKGHHHSCVFLLAFLEHDPHSKMGSTLKGKNLLLEEQILSFKSRPLLTKGKNESGRVVSPESVSIYLNVEK